MLVVISGRSRTASEQAQGAVENIVGGGDGNMDDPWFDGVVLEVLSYDDDKTDVEFS